MNAQVRARFKAVALTGGVVAVSLFTFARCGGPDPAAQPRRAQPAAVTTTGPGAAPEPTPTGPVPVVTSIVGAPGPATTSGEAAPRPPTTPAPVDGDVGRVAVGFLHAWVLRADIDTRRAELAGTDTPADPSDDWALPDYAGLTAFADPARLPPGERVTVESVDVRGALGATVVAYVDGIKVRVDLTRTGAGYRVDSHTPLR